MRIIKAFAVAFIVTFLLAGTSLAGSGEESKAEYSADRIMETGQMTMESKIYHTPDKDRTESSGSIVIMRRDKGVLWILMPSRKMYMERSFSDAKGQGQGAAEYTIDERKVIGKEVVNGVETTKMKIAMTMSDGSKFGGVMWTTKEGITVKMDTFSKVDGKKMRMKMELRNLKIGKQDTALFEIPPGYNKMGGMMGRSRGNRRSGGGDGDSGSGSMKDKMMKKMFRR